MQVLFRTYFQKKYRKLGKKLQRQAKNRIFSFIENPSDPQLQNHPLRGKYNGYFSINITGDYRAIYIMIDKNTIEFTDIDTHNKLYGWRYRLPNAPKYAILSEVLGYWKHTFLEDQNVSEIIANVALCYYRENEGPTGGECCFTKFTLNPLPKDKKRYRLLSCNGDCERELCLCISMTPDEIIPRPPHTMNTALQSPRRLANAGKRAELKKPTVKKKIVH